MYWIGHLEDSASDTDDWDDIDFDSASGSNFSVPDKRFFETDLQITMDAPVVDAGRSEVLSLFDLSAKTTAEKFSCEGLELASCALGKAMDEPVIKRVKKISFLKISVKAWCNTCGATSYVRCH